MITLVIGGTRSGKSEVAEGIAAGLGEPVTVIVPADAIDAEQAARIAAHRDRRPAAWLTVECGPELVDALAVAEGTALVDSLGTWLSVSADLDVGVDELVGVLQRRAGPTVVVTEEVGLAVHPTTDLGRRFVDALGTLNAAVARVADDVRLVVAGRSVRLEP